MIQSKTSAPGAPMRPSRIVSTLKALFRTRITAGLLIVLPIYVTWFLVRFVFSLMRDSSLWVVELVLRSKYIERWLQEWGFTNYTALQESLKELPANVQWAVAIFSVFLTIFLLYAIGLFAANIFGRRAIIALEALVDRVPFVKTVYRSSKQILETFTGDQTQNFQRVALIPFPQERMRCVGFITSIVPDAETQEELATVFIPTTPNPTTGYLQVVKRKDLIELDWSVEDAVRTIMSGGILRPDYLTMKNLGVGIQGFGMRPPPAPPDPIHN